MRQKCGRTLKCQHCRQSQTLGSFSGTNCQNSAACKSGRRLWRRLDVCSALFWFGGRLSTAWHFSICSCGIISPLSSCPFFWSTRIAHILSFELKQFEFRRRWHCANLCSLRKSCVKWCLSVDFLAIAGTQKCTLFSTERRRGWKNMPRI